MRRVLLTTCLLGLGTLCCTSSALGASTRTEYAAQVNQICAAANEQTQQLAEELQSIKRKKRLHALSKLDVRFAGRALAISAGELTQLQQVLPAAGDESLVASWLLARAKVHEFDRRLHRLDRELISQARHIRTRKDDARLDHLENKEFRLGNRSTPFLQADRDLGRELGVSECVKRYAPVPLPGGGGI
jgi:hypothetical protein